MTPLASFMFAFSVVLLIFGWFIFLGNGEILRSYRSAKIRNKKEYDRFLGKSVASCALVTFLSGLGDMLFGGFAAISILIAGMVVMLVHIAKKSNKYH